MEDVDGVAGADDFDVAARVKDVGRVHGGRCGALRRWRPWTKIAVLVFVDNVDVGIEHTSGL